MKCEMDDCSLLPQDEKHIKEYQELQEKIKCATETLAKKEKELKDAQNEFGQNLRKCQQMKSDVQERSKTLNKQSIEIEEKIRLEEVEISTLHEKCQREQMKIHEMEDEEAKLLEKLNTKSEADSFVSEKLEILQHLSGITLNYIEGPVASFSIARKRNTEHEESQEIEVVLTFKNSVLKTLVDVKVYPEKHTWSELIDSALRQEISASELLHCMQRMYKNIDGLEEEIEFLQNRYAIDWQPEQKLLTVILPNEGQAMCKLQLNGDYPGNQSIECTYTDELLKGKIDDISKRVRDGQVKNLTEWLELLHCPSNG
ncbi:uncharacterized protein LOC135682153 isoform X1 [Rhopilema esculentum]|uniref:uncharacterized protein LOC135682153 isoform X1 n=2 Tax=Rhopilema esculentum TaxID=499914 RepID=UPI0031E06984